jgi:hypothetical protein
LEKGYELFVKGNPAPPPGNNPPQGLVFLSPIQLKQTYE